MFMQRRALMLTFVLALCAAGCVRSGSPFVNPKKDASGAEGAVTTDDGGDSDGVTVVDGDGTSDTDSTGTGDDSTGADDSAADGDGSGTDTGTGTGSPRPGGLAPAVVATWNLHNFSKYGSNEFRLDDIEATIEGLGVDVLAVQELKLKEGTTGDSEQAWDLLLDNLEGYDGVHAPWDSKDSTVGLIWNTATTTVDDWEVIFENEWSAFPRPPIDATVTVTRDGGESTFHVVVLHLKAFKDSVDRRREACKLLVEYEASHPDDDFVIIGDFNDDPYDPEENNSYVGTFLDNEPAWYFVSKALPLGTVTSTGYGTSVNGQWKDGEFLDHAVVSGALYAQYASITPTVLGKPESEFAAWKKDFSDHFPLLIELTP